MKQVFVKNTSQYRGTYSAMDTVKVEDRSTGRKVDVKKVVFTKTFAVPTRDKDTGAVISTGFTPLDEAEYKLLLSSCPMFAKAVKAGRLVMYADAPVEALLDSQLLDRANAATTKANARVKELEKQLELGADPELLKKIAELEAINADLKKANEAFMEAAPGEGVEDAEGQVL
jgi:hypothetical protein